MLDPDTRMSAYKVVTAWVLTITGAVTLQDVATGLAIVFTGLQIYVTVRDKIVAHRAKRGEG
jgi:hypothetical protein